MMSENILAQMLFGHDLPLSVSEKETVKKFANTYNMARLLEKAESHGDDQQSLSE